MNQESDGLISTGVMCMVSANVDGRDRCIDMGTYYTYKGQQVLLAWNQELAKKYGHLVDCPIYLRKEKESFCEQRT